MVKYSLASIRQNAFKKQNNFWNVIFAEHFALPLLWLVANFTNWTPNFVTGISFIFFIAAAILFSQGYWILAAVIFMIGHLFDIVDGRLASLKKQGSKLGQFMDTFVDLTGVLLITIGIACALYQQTGSALFIWLAFAYTIANLFLQVLYNVSYNINEQKLLITKMKIESKSLVSRFRTFLANHRIRLLYTNVETNAIIFFICPLATIWISAGLAFTLGFAAGIALLAILFMTVFILQLKVLLKNPETRK